MATRFSSKSSTSSVLSRLSTLCQSSVVVFASHVLMLQSASAGETVKAGSSRGSSSVTCDCSCLYKKNQCGQVKDRLPVEQKNKVLVCSEDAATSQLQDSKLIGCFHGVFDSTVLSLLRLPANLRFMVKSDQACDRDPYAKLLLLKSVAHSYEPGMLKIMVDRWACGDIATEVQHREERFFKSINDKRDSLLNSPLAPLATLGSADLESALIKSLNNNEREFFQNKVSGGDSSKHMLDRYGTAWNCFTPYERLRLYCDDVSSAAMLVGGALGLAKFGAVQAARIEATELTRLPGLASGADSSSVLASNSQKSVTVASSSAKVNLVEEVTAPPAGMVFDKKGLLRLRLSEGAKMQKLQLITPAQLKELPRGTVLFDISGQRFVVGTDLLDTFTSRGFLGYGFKP